MLRYGLDETPLVALDIDHDGAWDLLRQSATNQRIERLELLGADQPEILRAASTGPAEGLHCGWGQIPPREVMRELLARPATP